jgi:hypothetical protein
MFSDFEIKRLIIHLERRGKEVSSIEDEALRIREKIKLLDKMAEINESITRILEGSQQDRSEYQPFGPEVRK